MVLNNGSNKNMNKLKQRVIHVQVLHYIAACVLSFSSHGKDMRERGGFRISKNVDILRCYNYV